MGAFEKIMGCLTNPKCEYPPEELERLKAAATAQLEKLRAGESPAPETPGVTSEETPVASVGEYFLCQKSPGQYVLYKGGAQ